MAIIDDRYIVAETLSEGWLDALCLLRAASGGKAVHVLIRILDPPREVEAIRAGAQWLIDQWNATHEDVKPDLETTRNTIFPVHWALRNPEPEDLASYYRARYTKDGLIGFKENERGTYFGRIVAYPRGERPYPEDDDDFGDQLTETVRKLRAELQNPGPKSSRYEINIYSERHDRSPRGFPCLAHISLHLCERRLHMQALYRNESLVARAYGNYLGLAQLQAYIAAAAEIEVGELLTTINHAAFDGTKGKVDELLARLG